ncbi:MAG: beta strand repeat-containing protein [Candidatus Krumholzibacteriia bacterium]
MKIKTCLLLPLLLAAVLVLTATSVLAVITPAGTLIRNRSSATYEDMTGNSFTSTSNEVITVVLPVYGVSILPDDSGETPPVTPAAIQNVLPGMTVYYRYDLTNTGNDNDSFSLFPILDAVNTNIALAASDVTIYHDLNGDGVVNVGEPVISAGGVPGNVGPLASGATASIILAYTVPVAATAGEVAYAGVEGASVGDGLQVDTRNYHLTTVVNDAVMTANLSGAPAVVVPGNQITYTLTGSNLGNNAANGVTVASVALAGVLIYDVIPVDPGTGNPLPIFGTPSGSPAGGTVLYLNAGNSTAGSPESWNWSTTSGPGDIAAGYITSGAVVPAQGYSFAYQVTVPSAMAAGVLGNTVSLAYVDNSPLTADPSIVISNNATVTIGTVATVLVGPSGQSGAGTPPNFNDDVQSVATAYAGTSVDFVNTVRNEGNATDQINVLRDGSSTIPAAWSVLFLQSDGVTPLVDNGVDGIPDVGPLAQGDSIDIVVRLLIPGNQAAGGPVDAVVRAQSTNDPVVFNLTTDRVASVLAASADIGNYNGGAGTNNVPVNLSSNPGTFVDFPLDVINPVGGVDTYGLSAALPAGWTVTFYEDVNGNGVLDAGEAAPIGSIGPVAGFAEANVIARVDVPAGTLPGVNPTSFTATSTNNAAAFDTIANTVTVNPFPAVDFAPDLSGTATPGGTIFYTHTVTNTGNVGDTFALSYVSSQGWLYVFYDALNNPVGSVTLIPGEVATVVAQLSVPAGVAIGTVETGALTATGNVTLVAESATDVTVIAAGNLDLAKSVNPATDQPPGAELTYVTDYQNLGTDSLANVIVLDAMPAFTQFKVGSASIGTPPAAVSGVTVQYSADGGGSWGYTPLSSGGGAPAGFDANVTNVRFVMTGFLVPGGASTVGVSFVVRIIAE